LKGRSSADKSRSSKRAVRPTVLEHLQNNARAVGSVDDRSHSDVTTPHSNHFRFQPMQGAPGF
jgi:hypothetical protein